VNNGAAEPPPIRWGILATGGIATSFVNDLRLLPDAQVAAVGSRSLDAAERFAAAHGVPRAHGSWQALADDPDVDVIYVATPHNAHYAATLACLRAGKPTLTEKPLTVDLDTATELVDTARHHNVFFMEAMWTRCFPAIARAAGLVADGAIGQVTSVHADFGLVAPDDPAHRLHARELAGGALLDVGVYPVTRAHLFLGAPDEIRAWADLSPQGVDRNTAMIFGYASGALASLTCSLVGDTQRVGVITGTGGRIELPRNFFMPRSLTLYRAAAWGQDGGAGEVIDLPHEGAGYHFEAAEVHRCLRAGLTESDLVPLSETLSVMSTLDRVRARIGVTYD
jgi:predicted dehydrogenase